MNWKAGAVAVLIFAGGAGWAGDNDELGEVRSAIENMKQEMEVMRATLASEREAIRASAGGAPEALKSANGKATVKIGGETRVRYALGFSSGYNPLDGSDRTRYVSGEWALRMAKLDFTVDLTPDTQGYIALRLDKNTAGPGGLLDEVWYRWSNIGGSRFAVKAGLQTLDLGMFNGEYNPWERVMVWDPFVKDTAERGAYDRINYMGKNPSGVNQGEVFRSFYGQTDITELGLTASYEWEQFRASAGIYQRGFTRGVVSDANPRNLGFVNHYVTVAYNPAWLEGLHLQASYFGEFDNGQRAEYGIFRDSFITAGFDIEDLNRLGAVYTPGIDLGAFYKGDRWAAYGEMVFIANQNYWGDSTEITFSVGADYNLTEKFRIGAALDYRSAYMSNKVQLLDAGINQWGLRASLGANYDFGNGLYIRAQYSHDWMRTYGIASNGVRDNDMVAFQTGFKF